MVATNLGPFSDGSVVCGVRGERLAGVRFSYHAAPEMHLQHHDGRWYAVRPQSCRSGENPVQL
jgi:hypothetical protein